MDKSNKPREFNIIQAMIYSCVTIIIAAMVLSAYTASVAKLGLPHENLIRQQLQIPENEQLVILNKGLIVRGFSSVADGKEIQLIFRVSQATEFDIPGKRTFHLLQPPRAEPTTITIQER